MPRHTKSAQGFRGRKAEEASVDLLDVLIKREQVGLKKPANKGGLTDEERLALSCCMVGRVTRMVGNGQALVYCQDNLERRCTIRGIMRSKKGKGGAAISVESIVVVALENPMTDLGESDDEGTIAPSKGGGGAAYIVGLFGDKDIGHLKRTRINKKLFIDVNGAAPQAQALALAVEACFDRGEDKSTYVPRSMREKADGDAIYRAARAESKAIHAAEDAAAAAAKAIAELDSDDESMVDMDDL